VNQEKNNPRSRKILETLWRWSGCDISTWILLASNIWVLILYLKDGADLGTILIIYWIQSVIIGFFNFFRILGLKEFSTEGLGPQSQVLLINTEGNTDPFHFRQVVWEGSDPVPAEYRSI